MYVTIVLSAIIVYQAVILFIVLHRNGKREASLLDRLMSRNFSEFAAGSRYKGREIPPGDVLLSEANEQEIAERYNELQASGAIGIQPV